MDSLGKTKIKTQTKSSSCKKCYARWDKRFAALIGAVSFMAIFGLLITDVCNSPPNNTTLNSIDISKYKRRLRANSCKNQDTCKLKCTGGEGVNIEEDVVEALKSLDSSCGVILEITKLQLSDNKIPEGWLNNIGREITELTILSSPKLLEISDGAFSGEFLKGISTLRIRDCTNLKEFKKDIFKNMINLSMFVLEYYSDTVVKIEKDFFSHVNTITTLQLTRCRLTTEILKNVFNSSVYLSKLVKVDLGYSTINALEAEVFDKATQIEAIYLRNTALTSLDKNVFSKLSKLNLISLEDNSLATLPEGIFDNIAKTDYTTITIQGNPWNCDCDLKWLKDMYLNENYISKEVKCDNGLSFDEFDFCPITGSTTTSIITDTTVSTISTTTTTITPKLRTISCQDSNLKEIEISKEDLVLTQTITVLENIFKFTFYESNDSPLHIKINIHTIADLNDFTLLWFNSYHPTDDEGCISNLNTTQVVSTMAHNNTYTICLLSKNEYKVNPYDCFGFKVRPDYPERAWIKNKTKTKIILLSTGILFLTMLISTCFMYWCVRFCPNLIKGNNRVIIIGKQKPKPQSVLKEYERPAYVAPSVLSYNTVNSANASYITSSNGYSRIKERNKRSPMSNIREESIYNGQASYINPMTSLEQDVNNWRQNVSMGKVVEENTIYEAVPPPLPPPNQKQIEIVTNQNLYSTA